MPKSNPQEYPPPLIFPPTSGTHKSTFIVLHGRGSTAEKFASPLLSHPVSPLSGFSPESQPQTFHSYFPNTKFIFPTASRRRAVAYNRSLTHQWFDMYPLDQYPPEHKEHVQLKGLSESAEYVHALLEDAMAEVGAKNVVLMGLSQGCAVGLVSLLLWKRENLGGFVGMCGWLPLRKNMSEALGEVEGTGDSDDIFAVGGNNEGKTKLEHATDWLREEIEFPFPGTTIGGEISSIYETPVFLGNGTEDQKVPCKLGTLATDLLKDLNINVMHEEYPSLGHWYSDDMLRDIVKRLKTKKGWLDDETET